MKKFELFFITFFTALFILQGSITYGKTETPVTTATRGYIGTLPDLTRSFEPVDEKKNSPEILPSKDFNSASELKPIPRDNPAFVNIILKSEKTSPYINDLNEFIPMLESLYDLIDNESNVQIFNAKVYYFNKSADYFRDKYLNKPESEFVSYKKLLQLSMHTHSIALLRKEAGKYNPYLAYGSSGYIYNPNNIREQLNFLKSEIQETILILKETN